MKRSNKIHEPYALSFVVVTRKADGFYVEIYPDSNGIHQKWNPTPHSALVLRNWNYIPARSVVIKNLEDRNEHRRAQIRTNDKS